jgi:hypothetical protein
VAKTIAPFTATQLPGEAYGWRTVDFANHLARFILEGFPRQLFTKKFYRRLMQEFGHIAHYDEQGFWAAWFETTARQLAFLENLATVLWFLDRDPLARTISAWVQENRIVEQYRHRVEVERETLERHVLEQLKRKYDDKGGPEPRASPLPTVAVVPLPQKIVARSSATPSDQRSLF